MVLLLTDMRSHSQLVGAFFVIGWNIVWTSLILLFIKYALRVPLRMSDEMLLIGDDAIHGVSPISPSLVIEFCSPALFLTIRKKLIASTTSLSATINPMMRPTARIRRAMWFNQSRGCFGLRNARGTIGTITYEHTYPRTLTSLCQLLFLSLRPAFSLL
jgi:hypothetical protein